jgi:hypothetical protein
MLAKSNIEDMVQQGMKCHKFISLSATTHIVSCPSNYGNPIMKSIKILVHGFKGTDKDFKIPVGHFQEIFPY